MKRWLILFVLFLLIVGAAGWYYFFVMAAQQPKAATSPPPPAAAQPPATAQPEPQLDTSEIYNLMNQERTKAKLKNFAYKDELYDSAAAKCEDMKKNNYYTHTSPSGVDYTTFIKKSVPTAKVTGENLGAGYADNASIINEWMQSPKHKENILNPKFTSVGVAFCGKASEKPGLIIVAHFIQG
jgi:uncharacterized protein YkwD